MKDDAQLIDASLQGDTVAFGELVRRYQGRLFNTLLKVTGSREESEDVGQEAFVQAFVKLDSFRGQSAFYTWLYRIAFNIAITRKRKKRVEASIDQQRDTTGDEPIDEGEVPTEQILREERAVLVHTAMGKLSEEHRSILVLREMEGCCYEVIADILQLSVGTVRSRLHRARLQLREELNELFLENPAE